ncbi:hypothetical protein GEMRC1_008959 [Eukaryota sp. GEM-RC1]
MLMLYPHDHLSTTLTFHIPYESSVYQVIVDNLSVEDSTAFEYNLLILPTVTSFTTSRRSVSSPLNFSSSSTFAKVSDLSSFFLNLFHISPSSISSTIPSFSGNSIVFSPEFSPEIKQNSKRVCSFLPDICSIFRYNDHFFVIFKIFRTSMTDLIFNFSKNPEVEGLSTFLSFISAQIFYLQKFFQNFNYFLDLQTLRSDDIRFDAKGKISVSLNFLLNTSPYNINFSELFQHHKYFNMSNFSFPSFQHLICKPLADITFDWQLGTISNLDFLTALNFISGRDLFSSFKPAFVPWIFTDFSKVNDDSLCNPTFLNWLEHPTEEAPLPTGLGFRNFKFSKTRLVKTDGILDRQFEQTGHHFINHLSDLEHVLITCRIRSESVLKKFVRKDISSADYPESFSKLSSDFPCEMPLLMMFVPEVFSKDSTHYFDNIKLPSFFEKGINFARYNGLNLNLSDHQHFIFWLQSQFNSKRLECLYVIGLI